MFRAFARLSLSAKLRKACIPCPNVFPRAHCILFRRKVRVAWQAFSLEKASDCTSVLSFRVARSLNRSRAPGASCEKQLALS
ncbi:hypothetical protein D6817_01020 [Candidatus Pacearchaeota archaeon]|nr:MAG: hypothetical protein D6817_01020 [Candidatus Pacearchaeota archaeon]